MNLEGKSRTLRRPTYPQVGRAISFRQNEEMRNTHRPSNIQEVLDIVTLFLLPIQNNLTKLYAATAIDSNHQQN